MLYLHHSGVRGVPDSRGNYRDDYFIHYRKELLDCFESRSNEYHTDVSLSLKGERHGWAVLDGELTTGFGTYEMFGGP